MSQRTVPEVEQHSSPTFPPVQPCRNTYSVQIELPDSDSCHFLGLPTLHNSPESDNLNLIAVGAKRDRKSRSRSQISPSGSPREGARSGKCWKGKLSPTGQRNLERTFASVKTQTSSTLPTQTPLTEPLVARSPEAYYTADQTDNGHT